MAGTQSPSGSVLAPSSSAITWVAAAFCVVASAVLLYQHRIAAEHDPWKSAQLLALKEQLRAAPADESLRSEIRRLDLQFRQRYFRRLSLGAAGGWLLVGGVVIFLTAARQTANVRTQPWLPKLNPDARNHGRKLSAQSRWSVVMVGSVIIVGLATLAATYTSPLPESADDLNELPGRSVHASPNSESIPIAEFNANWPRFRGPDGGGATTNGEWQFNFERQPIWKSPIPASGYSSPIVWNKRVFISGGDAAQRKVFCFDTIDGKLLWQRAVENVPGTPAKQPDLYEQPGYAASTMATDGQRVFVIFANGDFAALTFDGQPVWSKNIGVPKNAYGYATSLAVWPGKLIVQVDQDENAPGGSRLFAFDCATGKLLWERTRPVPASWASPIVIEAAGRFQIITLGQPWIISYSPADGNELWRAELLDGEITPSPVFAGGLVIAVNPSGKLLAIRSDGSGNVTRSHVAWTVDENVPDVTSPASNGELVFTVTSTGGLACFDIKDGRKLWEQNLEMEVQSSPGIMRGRLVLLSTRGDVVIAEAGREFKEIGRTKLQDAFYASPAFVKGRIYLRGTTNLWCIGGPK